jgi:hypothetical protein
MPYAPNGSNRNRRRRGEDEQKILQKQLQVKLEI